MQWPRRRISLPVHLQNLLPIFGPCSFTRSQTTLSRELRKKNIRKAFALSPNIKLDFKKKYILVDDVFTTGSTANACAKVLKKQAYAQSNLSHLDTDKCCFN